MKLYDFGQAPNCRRVRMFAAEKGMDIPKVEINLAEKEQLKGDYDKVNPLRQVPALELDDGTILTESVAICMYLEGIQPDPALMGRNVLEKSQIMMWDRRMEQNGFAAVAEAVRNSVPFFEGRGLAGPHDFEQIPALAERGKKRIEIFFDDLDERLGESEFIAGDKLTIADITAFVAVGFSRVLKADLGDRNNAVRWRDAINERASAKA